jgi:hypothetical protein
VRLLLVSLFGLLLCLPLRAEDLVAKVQRELRARKFYFGEINGRATDESLEAIKHFQLAKGIDNTGQLDGETLRALGFPDAAAGNREEARLLEECHTCVLRYLQAWQSGDWEREKPFYEDVVNYYYDQNVNRDFIREARAREIRRWPHRKATLLNRIVSLKDGHPDQALVTTRVHMDVAGASDPAQARTEDLIFWLRKTEQGWRIAALKLLE